MVQMDYSVIATLEVLIGVEHAHIVRNMDIITSTKFYRHETQLSFQHSLLILGEEIRSKWTKKL